MARELASPFNSLLSPFGQAAMASPSDCRKTFGELERIEPSRILNCTSGVHDGARRLFAAKSPVSSAETGEDCMRGELAPRSTACQALWGQAAMTLPCRTVEKTLESSKGLNPLEFSIVPVACTMERGDFLWRKISFPALKLKKIVCAGSLLPVQQLTKPFWAS